MLSNHPNCLGGNTPLASIQLDLDFGSTQGSVIYRSASAWTALTPGSSGQFLTTNGAAANPSWGTGTGVLPSQTSNSGKLLTTDGTNAAWTTTGVLTSLTSPASTDLTLAGGAGTSSIILTPAGTGGVGIGTITPAQKLSLNGTMQWAQTADAGYSGYLTNASTNAAYNPAITRNLIGSTNSTYTIAHGDMDAYAGIQFGISGTNTNAGNISFFAASGTFATNESVTPVARMFIANTGDVSISSTTAGSSSAGALIVQGGISVGNTGSAASYFGGAVTAAGTGAFGGSGSLGSTYLSRLSVFAAGGGNFSVGGQTNTDNTVVARMTAYNASNGNSGNESSTAFMGIASIESVVKTATGNAGTDSGGDLVFLTKGDGGTLTERMRLLSTGAATFAGAVTVTGALKLGNAYVAGAVVGTGSITIQDSTGTTYRIPVLV